MRDQYILVTKTLLHRVFSIENPTPCYHCNCNTDPKQKTVSLAIWRPEKAANQYRIIANFPLGLFDSHCLVTLASLARKVASTRIK